MNESRNGNGGNGLYGAHGRALVVDLSTGEHRVETIPGDVFRQYLGGYGLGAWLMWKHFPAGAEATAPEACFALVSGLLTGLRTPFSGRIQIVGKSPLTGTWADSNSGGSTAIHLRHAGYDALVVRGRAAQPSVLVVRADGIQVEPAGDLWGTQIPEAFDALQERYGTKFRVGVSAIGPAGEGGALISSVMNDRYHAFGRQGFGAVFGSKNLKAVVVDGGENTGNTVPVRDEKRFRSLCEDVNREYRSDISLPMRLVVKMAAPKKRLGFLYQAFAKFGIKIESPQPAMRQMWADRGTTAAVALSVENGDAPLKNWTGVGARDFPLAKKGWKLDGAEVDKLITKKLSCGDCPAPCKGIVGVKKRGLSDVRRPDYETIVGFGANILNDDLELVTACHDACNRYGMDAVSSSATIAWVCEAVERGDMTADDLDGVDMRWGYGEGALALTVKMGEGEGCGAWLRHGLASASRHVGRGTDAYAVHVGGQEPAYHDPRFTSLMGVTYIADPTPGRHTAGSASWNETFGAAFPLPEAVDKDEVTIAWKGTKNKGVAQAHYSNAHQTLNGLGLCMFTGLTGGLPWVDMVNALTGWEVDQKELMLCGERIQNLRNAFNLREGVVPADFKPHARMMGEGDGLLDAGPLAGIQAPLDQLKRDYYQAMSWDPETGRLSRTRAEQLGMDDLLEAHLA